MRLEIIPTSTTITTQTNHIAAGAFRLAGVFTGSGSGFDF